MVHFLSFSQIAPCHYRYSHRNPHRIPPSSSAVPVPAGAFSIFLHCRSNIRSRRSLFYISINNQAALPPLSLVFQRPSTTPTPHLQPVSTPAWGRGAFWVRAKCRARTPLSGRGEYPGLGNNYRARSPLLGQHAKYA